MNSKEITKNSISIVFLSTLLFSPLVINANHQDDSIQDAIRNPTADNAKGVFQDTVPNELEGITESAIEKMDDHIDSELVAEETLFGIFDIVENDVFGENITKIAETFGDRILQLVTNIFTKAIEASFNI